MQHKMGIIGYGGVAVGHHENSKHIKNIETVAAYDIDPERLKVASERGLKAYDKLADFLNDESFDMVLVSTPNNFHKPMVIAALNAGKNVICEKPVALSAADFDDMCDAAKRANKLFAVHQNRRWDRDYRTVKKVIEDGLIGKPYTIESRVQGQNGVVHGWRAYKVAGGGMVYDWGAHLVDQMLWLIKEKVIEVYANLHMIKTPEVDDYFKTVLRFESGLTAQIEFGSYHLTTLPRWYVCGDSGSVTVDGWDCKGKIVRSTQIGIDWVQETVQTDIGPILNKGPRHKETVEELPLPEVQTDYSDYYNNYLAVLDGKEELIVKPEEVRRAVKVIDAIFESHETGEAIKVNI